MASEEEKDIVAKEEESSSNPDASLSSGKLVIPIIEEHDTVTAVHFWQYPFLSMARNPLWFLSIALILTIILSVIAMTVGDFKVVVDGGGWIARGTLIADRHSQFLLVHMNREELLPGNSSEVWEDLIENIQPSWETVDDDATANRRLLSRVSRKTTTAVSLSDLWQSSDTVSQALLFPDTPHMFWADEEEHQREEKLRGFLPHNALQDRLLQAQNSSLMPTCDLSLYHPNSLTANSHLWPIWQPKVPGGSALLGRSAFKDLCQAEEHTLEVLKEADLCIACGDGTCMPPYSIVLLARLTVDKGMQMECDTLAGAWGTYVTENNVNLQACIQERMQGKWSSADTQCIDYFGPILVDVGYATSGHVALTSTVFLTKDTKDGGEADLLYDYVGQYDHGNTATIEGAYDTQDEHFVKAYINEALASDMILALASVVITMSAIVIHTRSFFLTGVGLLQIGLSFPLSYFIYALVMQYKFFPFLCFIGVFVVFALGADDVFVAVDKWKNARLELGLEAPTREVALMALPDAAGAMFLTTLTTAVAFFGTAVCPVACIKMFSIFCGLLIVMDYLMCILLVFPALCIYDRMRFQNNFLCHCNNCHSSSANDEPVEDDEHPSLIHRILAVFYQCIHVPRYILALGCAGALVSSALYAAKIELPSTSGIRVLKANLNEYERNYVWRQQMLYQMIEMQKGSAAYVMWGTVPADTGDHDNPDSFSQLVLDETFEPSKTEAQLYLYSFCDNFFGQDFANPIEGQPCPMHAFNTWLKEQAAAPTPDTVYTEHCGGARGLPLPESIFDACITNWSRSKENHFILAKDGKVKVMYMEYNSRVQFFSPFDELRDEWNLIEEWMQIEATRAPPSANGFFFTSRGFWWYDTNGSMLNTAFVAAAIAIAVAGAVILFSSKSFILTVFSCFTIGYVLASVTAVLVAMGWTLG